MITNLLATLTIFLSTNVTEIVTQYEFYESLPHQFIYTTEYSVPTSTTGTVASNWQWPGETKVGRNPLAKHITTTVTRTHRLVYDWMSQKHTNDLVETVSSTNKFYKLHRSERWLEQ